MDGLIPFAWTVPATVGYALTAWEALVSRRKLRQDLKDMAEAIASDEQNQQ